MKKNLLLLLLTLLSFVASAKMQESPRIDFNISGVNYTILSYQSLTVAVVPYSQGGGKYEGDIVIPATVEYGGKTWTVIEIADKTFSGNSTITSVTLPSTIKKIGSYAFNGSSNISPIKIPDGVEYIGGYSFPGIKIDGTLPKSLIELGEWAFSGAQMDEIVIPNQLKHIPAMAFANINAPVTFNDNVESIEINAFYNNLTFVNLVIPASVKTIGSAFQGCTNIETVQLPKGLLELGSYHSLPKLRSINIPDSITKFGPSALANDPLIDNIHWPKFLSTIEGSAFMGTGLKVVRFPEKLYTKHYPYNKWGEIIGPLEIYDNGRVSIGSYAFANCMSLDTVYITDVVSSIGSEAFSGSTNIRAVVTTKDTPMSINTNVFSADTYLNATLYVPFGTMDTYKSKSPWNNFVTIKESPKESSYLTYIVDGEVYKTYKIKIGESIIPEPAPTEEGYTFSGWSDIPDVMPAEDVTINGSFTINTYKLTYQIDGEDYKLYDVDYGATITPEEEPTKDGYVFSGWSEIPITMPNHNVVVEGSFNKLSPSESTEIIENMGIYYKVDKEAKTAIVTQNPDKYSGEISIPESFEYEGISYEVVSIEGGTYNNGAFANCIDMTTVTLPNTLKEIGYEAFGGCTGLTTIIIPDCVNSIEPCAFRGCSNLQSAILPNGILILETSIFANCKNLQTIEIPETVMKISACVFSGCTKLSSISLPRSIESIGYEAFRDCFSLRTVFCYAQTVPETNIVAFQNLNLESVLVLYVLPELVEDYKETVPWLRFKEILPIPTGTHKLMYMVDDEEYKSYDVEFGATIIPEPAPTKDGFIFSGWSTIPATMPAEDVTITGTFLLATDVDEITIKDTGKTTWCSEYDLDFTNVAGVKAYTATGYNNITKTIWLTRVMEVPAGTGILVKGDAGTYKIPHAEVQSAYANWFVGNLGETISISATDGDKTNYYLSGKDGTFKSVNGSANIGTNKAYLQLPTSVFGGTRSIGINYDDEDGTTSIKGLTPVLSEGEGEWFTLQGQRVAKPGKGLYIRNGKKVIVR